MLAHTRPSEGVMAVARIPNVKLAPIAIFEIALEKISSEEVGE